MNPPSDTLQASVFGQRLRADALTKAMQILVAADTLLRTHPAATLEDIGQAAGVSRTTVYRRFPTRQDLSVALSRWTKGRIVEALRAAHIGSAPAYVALYQAVHGALEVKVSLAYARTLDWPDDPVVAAYQAEMSDLAAQLVHSCQNAGLIQPNIEPEWAQAMLYALVDEASRRDDDVDELTRLVVDSFLHGVGSTEAPSAN